MAETITESFCERCGTRYEFKAPTRLNPLRKTRGLIGGLKNYVMSQDALSDAIGDAMRSEEEQLASAQLDAFHESFNFCIDCRQYTCVNCWNEDAGRCRSCAPIAGTDDLAERVAASLAGQPIAPTADPMLAEPLYTNGANDALVGEDIGVDAWPTSDLPEAPGNGYAPEAWPVADGFVYESEGPAEDEPVRAADGFVYESPVQAEGVAADLYESSDWAAAAAKLEPEPEITFERAAASDSDRYVPADVEPEPVIAEAEPELEPVVAEVEPEPEPVGAEPAVAEVEPERPRLRVVAWDEDAAYDLEPEAVTAAGFADEPVVAEVEPEPEPVVAEVEPEPEPVAPPRIAPISDTILRFPQRPAAPSPVEREPLAAEDESPELAARRAQLDLLGLGDPGEGPVQPTRPTVLPYRSRGAAISQGELAARAAANGAGFWEASAREVAGAAGNVGVQNCGQCGLSLSANARFCRRCGTRQARSA